MFLLGQKVNSIFFCALVHVCVCVFTVANRPPAKQNPMRQRVRNRDPDNGGQRNVGVGFDERLTNGEWAINPETDTANTSQTLEPLFVVGRLPPYISLYFHPASSC
jgi:hypothetical protein